jgi:hypothetical protein
VEGALFSYHYFFPSWRIVVTQLIDYFSLTSKSFDALYRTLFTIINEKDALVIFFDCAGGIVGETYDC